MRKVDESLFGEMMCVNVFIVFCGEIRNFNYQHVMRSIVYFPVWEGGLNGFLGNSRVERMRW